MEDETRQLGTPDPGVGLPVLAAFGLEVPEPETLYEGVNIQGIAALMDDSGIMTVQA